MFTDFDAQQAVIARKKCEHMCVDRIDDGNFILNSENVDCL